MSVHSARLRPVLAQALAIALAASLAISTAAASGSHSSGPGAAAAPPRAALTAFRSCDRLRGYLLRHRRALARPPVGSEDSAGTGSAAAAAEPGSEPAGPGSSTNLQEPGVDEPDLVKVRGSTLFALAGDRLRAVALGGGKAAVLGSIGLPGGHGGYADRELLIAGDRALVITRSYGPLGGLEAGAPDGYVAPATTELTEIEIGDPTAMTERSTMIAEGDYLSARLTGSTARVVIAAYPRLPLAAHGHGRAFMPGVSIDGPAGGSSRRRMVDCRDVRRPRRFSGAGMLTVLTIDLDRGLQAVDADAVITSGETVYASATSLYVATEHWTGPGAAPRRNSDVRTEIHRFDASDPRVTTYAGSGSVDGYMLGQWSMSEYEGVLRVASTTEPPSVRGARAAGSQSLVTSLAPGAGGLRRVGRLGGLGRGERIYAVRFLGPTAYVVTFRRVDPLYALDLSDPKEPRLTARLRIPGYSAYLHPVGDGLLLGVGDDVSPRGVPRGAEASLFDVSDPSAPLRLDHVSLGRHTETEVAYDHHAFTYSPADRLAIVPFDSYRRRERHAAVGIRIGADRLALSSPTSIGDSYATAIRRSLVRGNRVYTVSDRGVGEHDLETLRRLALTSFTGRPSGGQGR